MMIHIPKADSTARAMSSLRRTEQLASGAIAVGELFQLVRILNSIVFVGCYHSCIANPSVQVAQSGNEGKRVKNSLIERRFGRKFAVLGRNNNHHHTKRPESEEYISRINDTQ